MDIQQRFAALPRARRGDTTVVIVDEATLAELIGDAQAREADLLVRSIQAAFRPARPLINITPPSTVTAEEAAKRIRQESARSFPHRSAPS